MNVLIRSRRRFRRLGRYGVKMHAETECCPTSTALIAAKLGGHGLCTEPMLLRSRAASRSALGRTDTGPPPSNLPHVRPPRSAPRPRESTCKCASMVRASFHVIVPFRKNKCFAEVKILAFALALRYELIHDKGPSKGITND